MSRKYLQTKKTTLSYSISDSETAIRLDALEKLDGTSVSVSDLGDFITFTIDPGTSKEEICSVTSADVTVNADGTVDMVVVRGLKEIDPYTTGGFASEHGTGAVVVFGNNPQLYDQFPNKSNANTFTALNIFTVAPQTTTDPVAGNDLTRLSYVQALVLGTLTSIDVVVPGLAGENISDGNLIYLFTDNKWYKCDADTASTVNNVLLGIAKGAGTTGNAITNGILLQGTDNAQSGLVAGEVQYASNTAGAISNTPGTTEVTVGVAKSATEIYFAPRFNQMITEDQQDALAGSSGTPSASNKYVTEADVAENTASKIVRRKSDSNVTVPTTPSASTDAASKAYVEGYIRRPRHILSTAFETAARFTTSVGGSGTNTVNTNGLVQTSASGGGASFALAKIIVSPGTSVFTNSPVFTCNIIGNTGLASGTVGSAFYGLGEPTVATTGHTFTVRHVGFKLVKAAGVTSLYATQADGTTETASAALTTVTNSDTIDLVAIMNDTSSVDYYWSKNGGAWSSATNLTTNIPSGTFNTMQFSVSSDNTATAHDLTVTGASYQK